MNIQDAVKKVIKDFNRINEFSDNIQTDFADDADGSVGLYGAGDALIRYDVLGNMRCKSDFHLYAVNQAANNYDRLNNSSFLLELGYYLRTIKDIPITAIVNGEERRGIMKSIDCSNAMLFSRMEGDMNRNVMYQIPIKTEYIIYK